MSLNFNFHCVWIFFFFISHFETALALTRQNDQSKCAILSQNLAHAKSNKVSDFWAQKLMGLDLAEKLLFKMQKEKTLEKPQVHIWDDLIDFDDSTTARPAHAASVASFFMDGYQASSHFADIGNNNEIVQDSDYLNAALMLPNSKKTQLINISAGWKSYSDKLHQAVSMVFEKKGVIVQAAGNSLDSDSYKSDFQPEDSRFIRVGSLSPEGLISYFSAIRGDFIVYAPSDLFLTAKAGTNKEYSQFGATSGATPMVTGALANALVIRPHLTRDEMKNLLIATSFKMRSEATNQTEYFIVNAYALLKAILPTNTQKLIDSENSFKKLNSLKSLSAQFPNCFPEVEKLETNCHKINESFDNLRESFYSNPNEIQAGQISCIYKSLHFLREASFFENWSANRKGKLSSKLRKEIISEEVLLRNINLLDRNYVSEILPPVIKLEEILAPQFYAYLMTAGQHLEGIKRLYESISEGVGRQRFLNKIVAIPQSRKVLFLMASKDHDLETRIETLSAFYLTEDTRLKSDLLQLANENEERIWMILSNFLNRYEPEIRDLVSKTLISKPSEGTQKNILENINALSESQRRYVIDSAKKSQYELIRKLAQELENNRR